MELCRLLTDLEHYKDKNIDVYKYVELPSKKCFILTEKVLNSAKFLNDYDIDLYPSRNRTIKIEGDIDELTSITIDIGDNLFSYCIQNFHKGNKLTGYGDINNIDIELNKIYNFIKNTEDEE